MLWLSVALKVDPGRCQELLAYGYLITKCSKAFRWPSWVLYDQEFRQSRVGDRSARWDEVDTCLYTQHFSGKSEELDSWCSLCCTADHGRRWCPAQQGTQRRFLGESGANPPNLAGRPGNRSGQVCQKYNRFNGDCRRGSDCPYRHVCSRCGRHHPVQRCPQQAGGPVPRGPGLPNSEPPRRSRRRRKEKKGGPWAAVERGVMGEDSRERGSGWFWGTVRVRPTCVCGCRPVRVHVAAATAGPAAGSRLEIELWVGWHREVSRQTAPVET